MKQRFTYFVVLVTTLLISTPRVWADDPYLSQELTFRANAATTVYLAKTTDGDPTVKTIANLYLQYSTDDGASWSTFAASAAASKLTIAAGSSLRLRRDPAQEINSSGLGNTGNVNYYWRFVTTGNYALEGNIMSLVDGADFATNTTIPASYCCFNQLFTGNKVLTDIANLRLPATTLKDRCYRNMFYGCTGLTSLNGFTLPATTLAIYCYLNMFYGCTGLTTLNGFTLPATTLAEGCYQSLFNGCTGLTTVGDFNFPTVDLQKYSCRYMFSGCTNLETAMPRLHFGSITQEACSLMFQNCKKLRATPIVEADSIGLKGCHQMFSTCGTTLTGTDSMTAGEIIVHNAIYNQGCQTMYAGSTRLKNAPAITAGRIYGTTEDNGGCRYMFQNLSGITSAGAVNAARVDAYGCSYMYTGCTKLKKIPKIKVRTFGGSYPFQFTFKGCTTLDFNNDTLYCTNLADYCYLNMFEGCTGITNTSGLHLAADTVSPYAYKYMFTGCTGITDMWDTLKISVIGNRACQLMFNGCTKIKRTSTIEVDSIGLLGCHKMFATCGTELTGTDSMTAGNIIVKKAIYNRGCEDMFISSTRLKNAPAVKAGRIYGTTADNGGCRYMFQDLTGISSAGEIIADTIDAYGCNNMYKGCSGLKKIPKITVGTFGGSYPFHYMFNGCTTLDFNKDTLSSTDLADYCYYYMFNGCTGITNTSELHLAADTVAPYAYNYMFNGCTGITDMWDTLKISVIGNRGCQLMFNGCKNLKRTSTLVVDSIGLLGCNKMFATCGTSLTGTDSLVVGNIHVNKAIYNQGCQEMFSGSTRINSAPNLYAKRIMGTATGTGGCYLMYSSLTFPRSGCVKAGEIDAFGCEQMYNKCTKLTQMDTVIITDSVGTQGCFKMFEGCTLLTRAPKIKANVVGLRGLYQMHTGRTPLVSSDTIFVHLIGQQGCEQMFTGCTGLTSLPFVAADSVGRRGCENMFTGCTKLALGNDSLPCKKIGPQAYSYLFNGCTGITNLGDFRLPAMQLSDSCYFHLFHGCTGLVDISDFNLPARQVAPFAYNNMFNACSNMTTAWDTVRTSVIGEQACAQMFNACKKLNAAPAIRVDSIGPKGCQQMFLNCSTSTTVGLSSAGDIIVNGKVASLGLNNIYSGCQRLTTAPNVIAGGIMSDDATATGGCYRMFNGLTGLTSAGYLRVGTIGSFGCQQMFQGCTKLTSMDSIMVDSVGTQGCLQTFYNCTTFVSTPKITAGVIGERGCYQMLNCTTAITTADTIRARKVYQEGFREMFNACTKLAASPYIKIDSVGQSGCLYMFKGCYKDASNGILTADSIVIDKMGIRACESMFEGCMRMTTIKGIHNSKIYDYACTNMFKTCTGLVDLSSLTLPAPIMGAHCYDNMFNGCTALTTVMPRIEASYIGEQSCYQMFNACTKLNAAPAIRVDSIGVKGCQQMFVGCYNSKAATGIHTVGDITVSGYVASLGLNDIYSGCQYITAAPNVTAGSIESNGVTATGGCYRMFNGLTKLTSAGHLRVGTVGTYGCQQMFYNCSTFANAPKITADVIGELGCYQMLNCTTAIATADTIRARKVYREGFREMFNGCKKLSASPYIKIDSVGQSGCLNMFLNCYTDANNGILTADSIVLGNVSESGCQTMFSGCKRLAVSPKIVADSIGYRGFYQMFNTCYASATVGIRKADTIYVNRAIGRQGCEEMFIGCQRMDTARAVLTTKIGEAGCKNMFQNCFKVATSASKRYSEGFGGSGTVLLGDSACHQMFNTCTYLDSCPDLRFSTVGAHACDKMFYLCNGLDVSPAVTASKVQDYGFYQMFNFANTAANVVPVGFDHARDITIGEVGNRGCYQMFFQCRNLSAAPNLTINKVGDHGCYQMFQNAYSFKTNYYGIASVGTFNINEIGSYGCLEMFSGCQRLEAAPAITATSVGAHGCEKMFYNCYLSATIGLQSAGRLAANTVANYGYASMFEGCKRLTTIENSEIRADYAGAYGFTKMFYNCTALVQAPALQVPELGQYACQYMFTGCTSLTHMSLLPAMQIGDYCYSHMYEGCTALANVNPLAVTTLPEGAYEYMFSGCTALTAAPAIAATTVKPNCYQFMFQNCTRLTDAPTLPATKLAVNCYNSMFKGCTALQTAPVLPATELQTGCYTQMFNGCSALNYIKVNFTDWRYYGATTDPTYNWVNGVSGTGQFYSPEGLDVSLKDAHHVPTKFSVQSMTSNRLIFDANTGQWPDGTNERVTINQSAIEDIPHPTKLNCVFTHWNTEADDSGDDLNLGNLADEDIIYYAQYQEIGVTLQKWLSNAIFLSITNLPATAVAANVQVVGGGAAKSCWLESSTADEGVYKLVFNKNDVSLHAGGVLDVTLTDEDDVAIGVFSVQIPFLITENTNSSSLSNTEGKVIYVLSGSTLTFNDNRVCDKLIVSAGAKAVIPAGYTLSTHHLILRGGDLNNGTYYYTSPQLVVNGSLYNTSGVVNYQYLTGLQQQYSLSLPADVDVADVTYSDGTHATFGITAYDGEKRSTGKSGWVEIWDPTTMDIEDAPTLEAGRGYTVYGVPSEVIDGRRRNYCYLNFPMTIDLSGGELPEEDSKTISVSHFGLTGGELNAGIAPNNAGWNLIGNPYLADFADDDEEGFGNAVIGQLQKNGNDEYEWVGSARYVVIPANNGQSYHAELVTGTTLPSFKNFFIQVGQGDMLSFAKSARAQNMPYRMWQAPEEAKETMLGVRVEGNNSQDRMALLLSDDYTDEYEFNADLDKWSTSAQMTVAAAIGKYSLAVAAISHERSKQPVALAVKTIKDGSYTFSLAEEWTRNSSDISRLYLYDKEEDTYTDLLTGTYTVSLASGKHNNRFSLITERRGEPTDAEYLAEDGIRISRIGESLSVTGIAGEVYVSVFNMTGSCVYSEVVDGDVRISLPQGIYIIQVTKDGRTYTFKTAAE